MTLFGCKNIVNGAMCVTHTQQKVLPPKILFPEKTSSPLRREPRRGQPVEEGRSKIKGSITLAEALFWFGSGIIKVLKKVSKI
jgi:hypothetical protein